MFTKNAGVIAPPSQYEFHWHAEFKSGETLDMFGPSGDYTSKVPFSLVQEKATDLTYIVWKGVNEDRIHFGVTFKMEYPTFMVNGMLLQPCGIGYQANHSFIPELFVRNFGTLVSGSSGLQTKDMQIAYFVGFKFMDGLEEKKIHISWDGEKLQKHGFSILEQVGLYRLKG